MILDISSFSLRQIKWIEQNQLKIFPHARTSSLPRWLHICQWNDHLFALCHHQHTPRIPWMIHFLISVWIRYRSSYVRNEASDVTGHVTFAKRSKPRHSASEPVCCFFRHTLRSVSFKRAITTLWLSPPGGVWKARERRQGSKEKHGLLGDGTTLESRECTGVFVWIIYTTVNKCTVHHKESNVCVFISHIPKVCHTASDSHGFNTFPLLFPYYIFLGICFCSRWPKTSCRSWRECTTEVLWFQYR